LNFINRITTNVTESFFVKNILDWSKRRSFPGSSGNSIFDIVSFVLAEIGKTTLMSRANAISFSFFISLFPSIIVLFSLIAYTPFYKNFNELIANSIHDLMPGNAEQIAMKTIKDLTTIKRNQLLSFGFLLAIFFSSNGMMAMMSGFEKAHKLTFRKYLFLEKRWIALKLTFLLGLLMLSSVVLGILGNTLVELIADFFEFKRFDKIGLMLLRWVLMILLLYGGVSLIYRLGVPLRKKLPLINPGATLATLLSILVSMGFSYYVDNFSSYNKVYGSIGTLIVFLLWLQMNVFNMLIGFELNASIAVNRDLREMKEIDTGQ
jgi:membrane protein